MKLQHCILAGFIVTSSFVIIPSNPAVSKSSLIEFRVRTVPGSTNDQKKKEEQKATPVKPQSVAPQAKLTSMATSENCDRPCSQSELLKNTQWAATGGKPK